jgi:putative sigma-54 modulation protein
MKIIFKGKNFVITESVKNYLWKKINSLAKLLRYFKQEVAVAEVEVGRITRRQRSGDIFRAEINLSIGGKLFRAESEKDNLFAAIDETRDDLAREIKKFKTKKETIFIRGARSIKKKFQISPLARFRTK